MRVLQDYNRSLVSGLLLGSISAIAMVILLVFAQVGVANPKSESLKYLVGFKLATARQIAGPKIITLSGSSGLFGLRADMISQATGKPTVNFGVAAALGMPTCCYWARELAHPGDTVLLAFEYDLYDWNDFWELSWPRTKKVDRYNLEYAEYLLDYDPVYLHCLTLWEKINLLSSIPNHRIMEGVGRLIRGGFRNHSHTLSREECLEELAKLDIPLDQYGDRIQATAANRPPDDGIDWLPSPLVYGLSPNAKGFLYLKDFVQWCHQNNVQVLATWPNLLYRKEYLLPPAKQATSEIANFYASQGVPVLGSYTEFLMPREKMYNTIYHPIEDGAKERTQKLLVYWPDLPH